MLNKDDTKLFKSATDFSIKCSCGHSILTHKKRELCRWCGKYVYKDKKAEFEDKLKASIKKEEK